MTTEKLINSTRNSSSNTTTQSLGSSTLFNTSDGQAALQLLVLTLAITGNSFIIFAYCRTFKMRTTTNTLVVNLCITDFFSAIFEAPLWIITLTSHHAYNYYIFCRVMLAFEDLFQVASFLAMCGIALDRYLVLVKGLKGRLTRTRVRLTLTWTWIQSLIAAVPWYLLQSKYSGRCSGFALYYDPKINLKAANILLRTICVILPIWITYYVFFCIVKAVRRRRRLGIENNYIQRNWSAEKFAVDAHSRSSKTAVVLFSMYVICTFPFTAAYIWDIATGDPFKNLTAAFMIYLILSLKRALFPAIYIFRNRAILSYLQDTMRCRFLTKSVPRSIRLQEHSLGYMATTANSKDSCFSIFGHRFCKPRVYPVVYDGENKHFPKNLDIYFNCGIKEQKIQSDGFTDIIEGITSNSVQEQEDTTCV